MKSLNNYSKLYLRDSLLSIALMFYSGNYIIMFLVASGVSNAGIGIFNSIGSFVSLGSMFLCGLIGDKLKDIRKTITLSFASLSVFYLVMIFFSIVHCGPNIVLIATIVVQAVTSFLYGFRNVLEYKLVYLITDIRRYARVTAVTGLVTGIVGVAAGFIISLIIDNLPYYPVMTCFFILGLLLIVIICLINQSFVVQREHYDEDAPKAVKASKDKENGFLGVLKSRHFYVLALPNLIRGISTGLLGLVLVIGIQDLAMNATDSSILNTVGMASSFAGSLVFSYLSDKVSSRLLCLVSSIIVMITIPFSIVGGKLWFYILYFLGISARYIVDGTIPVMVTQIVPYEQMGAYTSLRMMLMTGGSSLASLVGGLLIGNISSFLLFAIAAGMLLICVVVYYLYAGICLKKKTV
ncbi:MAG: MFS transporter [Firmicutes bacterium]|nr:MFS transporter [Bacillota bacterium]